MARFTVLQHFVPPNSQREDHFDLLLEDSETLITWEFPDWPPIHSLPVCRLPDHRKEYLDFEGELSGNRGHVTRVDQGSIVLCTHSDERWKIELQGQQFTGMIQICLGQAADKDSSSENQSWTASVLLS
jgi:hypothetical protein